MCGIAGVFARSDKMDIVRRMSRTLIHRGPDDCGDLALRTPSDEPMGAFALRRLAIQDLSPAGHQPMVSTDGRYAITYNGEIYNFGILRDRLLGEGVVFRGHSDTEVILNGLIRHGSAFIKELRGMFAFAFWDSERRRGLIARDVFGIKPLYYAETGDSLYFASEVRTLLATDALPRVI